MLGIINTALSILIALLIACSIIEDYLLLTDIAEEKLLYRYDNNLYKLITIWVIALVTQYQVKLCFKQTPFQLYLYNMQLKPDIVFNKTPEYIFI